MRFRRGVRGGEFAVEIGHLLPAEGQILQLIREPVDEFRVEADGGDGEIFIDAQIDELFEFFRERFAIPRRPAGEERQRTADRIEPVRRAIARR